MKNFFLTDAQIQGLIDEPKVMGKSTDDLLRKMVSKPGRRAFHRQHSRKFSRGNGEGYWQIYLRCSTRNKFDFSCGLGFIPKGRKVAFTLMRCNGKSHGHINTMENQSEFYDFHIHRATERYQHSSHKEEHYAEPTDRYVDLRGALMVVLFDCNVGKHGANNQQSRLV